MSNRPPSQLGSTLYELIVTLGLFFILSSFAVQKLTDLNENIDNSARTVEGFLKQARAHAVSSTSAILLSPLNSSEIQVSEALRCGADNTSILSGQKLQLPESVEFASTDWTICFSARGFPEESVTITLKNSDNETRDIELALGGAIRRSS